MIKKSFSASFLREIDTDTFQRAGSTVVDSKMQGEEESGDAKAAVSEGQYDRAKAEAKTVASFLN